MIADGSAAPASIDARPGVPKPDPILVVDGATRSFGGLLAVDVDHLEVQRGTVTSIIGPNGAGKTTFFNLLTGFDRSDAGTWSFDGHPISKLVAHRIARRGMIRTFQLTRSLSRLSVLDNVMLGLQNHPGERLRHALFPGWRAVEQSGEIKARELLDRFGLAEMAGELAGTLSGGQRKLLEMARALMADPSLIMLDEPMAGVNPVLTESLLGHITGLRDEGRTVVFVEHDMDVVMEISDCVVVLAEGRVIAEGPPQAVATDSGVIDAYLGRVGEDSR